MNKILLQITKASFIALLAITGFGITTQQVFAAYSINTASNDCPTYMVVNATRNPQDANTACWPGTNITVGDGDTINTAVYFHNSGTDPAPNVSVRISDIRGEKSAGQLQTIGQVYINGTPIDSNQRNINLESNVTITFAGAYIQTQSNRNWTLIPNGTAIFNTGGINIGTVNTGWPNQGVVKAVFKVTANTPTQGTAPTIQTQSATNIGTSSATLNGTYSSNHPAQSVCFDVQFPNGNITKYTASLPSGSSFSTFISGLTTGTYQYRACGSNQFGSTTASNWVSFYIQNGIINSPVGNTISVVTQAPTVSNLNSSVTFYGNYYNSNLFVNNTYFNYRPIGGSTRSTPSAGSFGNNSRGFNYIVSGLSNGTWEYQACADNGTLVCGSWVSFTMNRDTVVEPPISSNGNPIVQTLTPVSIGNTTVIIDAFYNMNGCSGRTYFEYGTTNNLGQTTGAVSRSLSGSMAQALTSLTPGVTYYYRPVVENCNGTVRGATFSVTTVRQGTTTTTTTIVRPTNNTVNTIVTGGASGTRYVRLTIDNQRSTVAKGEELVYDVAWENISNVTIRGLILEITFPKALQITGTDRGRIDRDANAVYVDIQELRVSEKDDITIRTRLVGNLKENDPVTARAIIAFENPENNQAQENAIAYDSDVFVANQNQVLGASVFGLGNLSGSLAGWLLLILVLILVVLIIRYMTKREEHHHYYTNREDVPVAPNKTVTHQEVDYTPYRPTPKE